MAQEIKVFDLGSDHIDESKIVPKAIFKTECDRRAILLFSTLLASYLVFGVTISSFGQSNSGIGQPVQKSLTSPHNLQNRSQNIIWGLDLQTWDIILKAIQTVGGFGFIFTAIFAWKNFKIAEKNRELSEDKQITERFSKAVELLSDSSKLETRLGGIYLLERIARDSLEDHPVVMEVLSSYIREHSRKTSNQRIFFKNSQDISSNLNRCDVEAAIAVIHRRNVSNDIGILDLTGCHLEKFELEGINLSEANLSQANLIHSNFQNSNLSQSRIIASDLSGAILSRSDLTGANFSDSTLLKAKFTRAKLQGAFFINSILQQVCFYGANLQGALLYKAKCFEAHLEEACLENAYLVDADLTNADLRKANLKNANLTNANLTNADLRRANLEDAILDGTCVTNAKILDVKGLKSYEIINMKMRGALLDSQEE